MLEALTLEVIPIFPDIGWGGDQYARTIDPFLVSPSADLLKAAACFQHLSQRTTLELSRARY